MENKEKLENIPQASEDDDELEGYIDIYDTSDLDTSVPLWQQMKEQQYAKLNVTVKQLDTIIGICVAGLIILAVVIGLDAAGIF